VCAFSSRYGPMCFHASAELVIAEFHESAPVLLGWAKASVEARQSPVSATASVFVNIRNLSSFPSDNGYCVSGVLPLVWHMCPWYYACLTLYSAQTRCQRPQQQAGASSPPVCQTMPDAVVWERKALGTQGERDSDAQRCTRGVDGSAPARWHTVRRMARCPYIGTSSCEHRRIGRVSC